jgi:hypothetical protein
MIFKVRMLAFGDPGDVREVDVPDEELSRKTTKTTQQNFVLELIFKYGQNDFQPQQMPSVSMGDVIEYEGKFFAVCALGFRRLIKLEDYEALTQWGRQSACMNFNPSELEGK